MARSITDYRREMARSTTGGMARSNTAWIDPPPYMYTLWMDPMSEKGLDQPPGDMAREMVRFTTREKDRSTTEEMAIEYRSSYCILNS